MMERPETFHRLRAVHVMKRRASCQAPAFASISASIQPALFTLFTAVHIPQGAEGGERRKMGVSHANSVGRPGRGVRLPARQRPRDSDGPEARGLRARPTRTPADPGPAGSCVRRTRGVPDPDPDGDCGDCSGDCCVRQTPGPTGQLDSRRRIQMPRARLGSGRRRRRPAGWVPQTDRAGGRPSIPRAVGNPSPNPNRTDAGPAPPAAERHQPPGRPRRGRRRGRGRRGRRGRWGRGGGLWDQSSGSRSSGGGTRGGGR